ncbi:MAG TPA: protein kinase [Frateuria sp.]|uniref:protein kinase domain-containing protein n=1 Tax=Frateuria sp. TaxID=2211372 RepID=UPI002D7E3A61|nr:protein kinase [Frateuria sp.]HET6806868.1 protein kinase [Frateuria sp.]
MSAPTDTGIYARMELVPGTLLAGRFRVEALLGVGGMGVVYRAHDEALGVPVAIKLLRPEVAMRPDALERFRQELLLARQVSSPHVVRIHDLAQHDGHWLISMDFVPGEGLDHRIDRGPLPLEEALRITRQIALGLQAAHARGVVHRDLKPANVLVDGDGNAYISDFGVARSLASSGLTHAGLGGAMGTPDYLSPEQARGDPVDTRSDLYALGLILREMLTGQPAFHSATAAEALAQRLVRTPPPVTQDRPEVPVWVARLVDRLLRTQPSHRLPDAAAVVSAIDRRALPRDWRPRWRPWHVALAVLAIGTLATLWWLPRHRPPVAAAPPPLHRLLVLPLQGSGVPATRLAALDAYLRARIANLPGVASVDPERTVQALRQLDAAGNRPDPATLRRVAVADRSLAATLEQRAGTWLVRAQLQPAQGNGAALDGPPRPDAVEAFRAWLAQPALTQALGASATAPPPPLPPPVQLDAFGTALEARAAGHYPAALRQVQALARQRRDDAVLWDAQLDLAQMTGEHDAALDAIEQGQRAAGPAFPRLGRRFAAEHALEQGAAPDAVALWRKQLAQAPDDTLADLQLARAQGAGGDFAAAIGRLSALVARDGDDPRAWYELGKYSILQGEARRAVDDYLVRALVLYKRSRNPYGVALTTNALGIGYGRLGQTDAAEEQYRKAVELQDAIGNRRGVATGLRNLANVLSLRGAFDEAGAALTRARALNEALDDRAGLAAVDNELGVLAEERGDFHAALAAYQRSLQGWQQVDDAQGLAQALNAIGFAYFELGRYDDAQSYWQRAAANATGQGETGRVRVRQNLGQLATARGRWHDAAQLQHAALAEAQQRQMPEEAAVSHRHLSELALLQGDLAGALDQADKAIALFRQRDDLRGEADARLLRARTLLAAGDADAVVRELDAMPTGEDRSREQRAREAIVRAELALRAGQARQAQAALAQAQPLAQASGVRELQLRLALLRAWLEPPGDTGLDAATAALGNAELRLDWLILAMRRSLAAHDADAALRAYREATTWMRGSPMLAAAYLHTLGARAERMAGDAAAAAGAERAATAALATLRGRLPARHGAFDRATEQLIP